MKKAAAEGSAELFQNPVGKKFIMAGSGLLMTVFAVLHLLGNFTFFAGTDRINSYSAMLQGLGPLLWAFRMAMAAAVFLHVYYGIATTLDNSTAKSQGYAVRVFRESSFAGRTMIWSGSIIGLFIIYHLLHFTLQVISVELAAGRHADALGRPDVFFMISENFRSFTIAAIYGVALVALGLHLSHGIQSLCQTFGLNRESVFSFIRKGGVLAALLIFAGFVAIPVFVLAGLAGR